MSNKKAATPGPKQRAHVFGFMDETGLLHTPDTDRIFGLGILVLPKTKRLHDDIVKYRQQTHFNDEFKFTNIRRNNLALYKGLVDIFFDTPRSRFSAMMIDKKSVKVKSAKHTKAYNAFAGELISRSILSSTNSQSEYITVLADDVSTSIDDAYEKEIKSKVKRMLRRNALFGVCRLESHALSEIQLCDVILGTIAYSYKLREGLLSKPNPNKVEIVKYIQNKIGVASLSSTFEHHGPKGIIFQVREKKV